MKLIALALLLMSSSLYGQSNEQYLKFALETKDQIFKNIKECGLVVQDVEDQYLQWPASKLIYAKSGLLLARYVFYTGPGNHFEWKNPNGGMVHSINQWSRKMSFTTPYMGTVAIVNRYTTIDGHHHNYLCRSRYVNWETWQSCVNRFFIEVVTSKLCRFGDQGEPDHPETES